MSHSMWPLDAIATVRQPDLLIALLSLSIALAAYTACFAVVSWPFHSDRDLVNKLYNEDFEHISDDNVGRIDLETAMWMFQGMDRKGLGVFFLDSLRKKRRHEPSRGAWQSAPRP